GDATMGSALDLLGARAVGGRHMEGLLPGYVPSVHRSQLCRFGYDQQVTAHNSLVRILWLQGFPDQAVSLLERNIAYAQSLDHELSLCNALGQCACPTALSVGDLAGAERYVAMLLGHAARHALPLWHAAGRCFDGVLRIRQGSVVDGLGILRAAFEQLSESRFETRYLTFLGEMAEAFCRAGNMADGRTTIDQALERCRRNEELWYLPELLRIKGEIALREGAADANAAEAQFLRSLDWARRPDA